jgi:hypothetical protein
MIKNKKKFTAKKKLNFLLIKTYNLPIPNPPQRTSKLQKKLSAHKREHPALQKVKFLSFLWYLVGHFCPPGSGSGFRIQIRILNKDLDLDLLT